MKTKILATLAFAAAAALPNAAAAQDIVPGEGFIGVSAGYHDLGVDGEDLADFGIEVDDSSPIVGVFAGYDIPIGVGAFAGVEANYTYGFDAIDSEVGASVRAGIRAPGGAKFYARGGYQWVDLDPAEIVNIDDESLFDDIDDSDGDFLVGLGTDFPLGNTLFRVNLDTVGFDTLRATAGIGLKF